MKIRYENDKVAIIVHVSACSWLEIYYFQASQTLLINTFKF